MKKIDTLGFLIGALFLLFIKNSDHSLKTDPKSTLFASLFILSLCLGIYAVKKGWVGTIKGDVDDGQFEISKEKKNEPKV